MQNTAHIKTDNIDPLMRDIKQYPRLTRDQEVQLYHEMHGQDTAKAEAAREKLICCNIRLVIKLAHDFKRYLSYSELVQEGCRGLVTAVDKYNPDINPRFSIGASNWIKNAMRKAILSNSRSVRVPSSQAQLAAKIAKTKHSFEASNGRLPNTEEISEAVGVSEYRVHSAEEADIRICSIDEQIDQDSATTFADQLAETIEPDDDVPEDMPDVMKDIHMLMNRMSDKDRFLLDKSYGLTCQAVPTEILAQETGMSIRCINGRLSAIYQHLHEVLKDKQYDL